MGGSSVVETALPSPVPGLRIIPSGPLPPDPIETLRNERLTRVLRDLNGEADFVLFDTSPLQLSGDALLLVPRLDRVFLLAGAGYSNRTEIETCLDALQEQDMPLAGIILNRLSRGDIGGTATPVPADPSATADQEPA
jgi:non-specific protein-tyrosine kinase